MTALTLYGTQVASSTLTSAGTLVSGTGGTSVNTATKAGTGSGYGQLDSLGNTSYTWPGAGSMGSPDGNGWLFDSTLLEGQKFASGGSWSLLLKIKSNNSNSMTASITAGLYIRSSSGTYTLFATLTASGQSFTTTVVGYTLTGSNSSDATFGTGDKLYVHVWPDITVANSSSTTNILNAQSSTSSGIAANMELDTPGYVTGSTNYTTTITEQLSSFDALATTSASYSYTTSITEQLTSFDALATTSANYSYTTSITEQLTSLDAVATVQKNGNTTITEQLTSFDAVATVSASAAPSAPGETVTIAGSSVMVMDDGSFEIDNQLSSSSTLHMVSRDDSGTHHFTKGQQVRVSDSQRGIVFAGNISTAEEDRLTPNTTMLTTIDCTDNTYFAAKRTYTGPEYENQYVGAIATDMLNTLTNEGVTANYASRRETTQGQFATGTLTNLAATTNVDDGDLELALAGSPVELEEASTSDFSSGTLSNTVALNNSLQPSATNAIKIQAVMSTPGLSSAYTYTKIWSGSLTVGSSNFFIYEIYIDPSSPTGQIGIDIVFSDGTSWRDTAVYFDVQSQPPSPTTDLTGLATGQWYEHGFFMANYSGKTISYVTIAVAGTKPGTYTGYVQNVRYTDSGRNTLTSIFSNTLGVNPPQQMQNVGYSSTVVSVVPTYNLFSPNGVTYGATVYRASPSYSIDAVKLLKNSLISYEVTEPANTKFVLKMSVDGGKSYVACANNAPIPNLPAGTSLAGLSIQWQEQFYAFTGASPEDCPVLNALTIELNPTYKATKSDVLYEAIVASDYNAGTLTNTAVDTSVLKLNGNVRNWDDGNALNEPLYSTNAQQGPNNKNYALNVGATTDARSRLDFAGTWQNFTAEVDIKIDSMSYGLVYRTQSANWQNNNNTFAYSAMVTSTGVELGKGTNSSSGSGSFTSIATATLALTSGQWHRLKVVVNGSNHRIYIDDVLMINATDSTYSAAGYIALRMNNTGTPSLLGLFDNFGVVSALSGTWLSPSIDVSGASSYGNSVISWRDRSKDYFGVANTNILVEATINGGTSWVTCTNGQAISSFTAGQSLAGVHLQLRVTLTSSVASNLPALDNFVVRILGAFSATGTRIGTPLQLLNVGRLGNSLVAWNANTPANTNMTVSTTVDGGSTYQSVASSGSAIPNLTTQPDPTIDSYTANTSANYTSTYRTGGSVATPTFDTANSRLLLSGGTNALYILNAPTGVSDVDIIIDMDESDAGGCVWGYSDVNDFYECVVCDASSNSGITNTLSVYRISSGARIVVATGSISFVRGVPHRIRVTMLAGIIVAYFDGLQVCTYTDYSPLQGLTGLRESGGIARFYQLRVQPQGQDVTALSVQTKVTLTTTDPTVSPQLLDFTLAAHNPSIGNGSLVPKTNFGFKYLSDNFNSLAKLYPNGWWDIDYNKKFSMMAHTGVPAPWIGTGSDFQDANLRVRSESPLYRNRQIVTNVLDTVAIDDARIGDGVTRTWTLDYPLASAPTITVNNVAALVGIKGTDTGKDFYYTVGDATIIQDSGNPTYDDLFTLEFIGTGQFLTYSQYDDTVGQAAYATIEGGSGIVENVIDGTGLTKAQGDALAQSYVQTYGVLGYTLDGTTTRDGLQIGQLFTVFVPEHNVFDMTFLIRSIKIHITPSDSTGLHLFWYTLEAVSGPDLGDWLQLYKH